MAQSRWILRFAACVALMLVAPGCGEHLQRVLGVTAVPEVQIIETRAEAGQPGLTTYRVRWTGRASGSRVDHYLIAIDPPRLDTVDSCWKAIREDQFVLSFSSDELVQARASGRGRRDFHVFAVRAVNASGEMSPPATRAFFADGIAPTVQITAPMPSRLISQTVTPSPLITWMGRVFIDPNGYAFEKPPKYKYTIYKKGDLGVNWDAWRMDPDSLRRQVAPEFAGWDSTGPDHEWVQYADLTVNSEYMFVVVAFDSAGDYSPVFSFDSNMLRMSIVPAGVIGPKITLFNSFFQYTYPTGGYSLDPSRAISIPVPGRVPLTLNWTAEPTPGSIMRRYRWVLDLENLDDETPRTDENDWYHWSPWSDSLTSATVGPFAARGLKRELHDFYVEAEDINGLVSLGWVHFIVVHPTFDKDLLIVNDTRFKPDERSRIQPLGRTDSLAAPFGMWPSRAELDTFLFAVGGVRWKMTDPTKPWWALSPAGIFKGYSFDTLGTRKGLSNPTIPLDVLNQYRHVIWMTDRASSWTGNPNVLTTPMPTLLYMSQPSRQNTLATWVKQGGQLWALGGGFGNHTNSPWNNPANDLNGVQTYSFDGPRPDLTPGRFMYDLAHWRSEFRIYGPAFVSYRRYDQPDPIVNSTSWKGGTFTNPGVDYTSLPTALRPRDPSMDVIWPWRTNTEFYVGNRNYSAIGLTVEYISLEHRMTEEIAVPSPTNPDSTVERSTLDSLYLVFGSSYPRQFLQSGEGVNTVMTYYYGRDNAPLVFSGMAIWDFTRTDCLALVDFVLGNLWSLPKSTLYTAPSAAAPSLTRRVAVPTPQPFQRPSGSVRQPAGKAIFQRRR